VHISHAHPATRDVQVISHGPELYFVRAAAWLAVFAFATQSKIRGGTGGNTPPQVREAHRGWTMNHHHELSALASVKNRQKQT
jgi:hypothetical protein